MGDTLIPVLRQLRAGYANRPAAFPQSIILCGIRDVRDYRIHSESADEIVTGGSTFNIKAESLRLGDLDEANVHALLGQHTAETGQEFTQGALAAVWNQSQGKPWLVNALAYEACFKNKADRDRSRTIDEEGIMAAREELVLGRQTHLHQLADKLREERVRRVIEPVLVSGAGGTDRVSSDDVEYVRDLGLLARSGPRRIANPIYRDVIPRELMYAREDEILEETAWYSEAGRRPRHGRSAHRIPALLPGAPATLDRALPVTGDGPAAPVAGVPAADREWRRTDRAGVRPRPAAYRSADRVAAARLRRHRRTRDARPPPRGGVQDPTRRLSRHDTRGR